ncbi:unannotated protein [freshwater metagenome]|uniref:Unannotated protein n=1 Tax=freshwater metagenome TaxID=449393 RepID=A0A6J7K0Z2_9ZZZZ
MFRNKEVRNFTSDDFQREIGETLRNQALRCSDTEDRFFLPPARTNEPGFFSRMFGVVAGIGLVRNQVTDACCQYRQVGVYGDATLQVSLVVVETRPRLIRCEFPRDVLTLG